ncbi:MAG TPA: hypothetical protein VHZ09_05795 [Acidobacteriaceae bacterium]|jgi:succinoglycan biosynthesis protein ExoV|nr:hypothetical protein [Acidobacteriaceae bacterium]
MEIRYFTEGNLTNFGDDINRWLWEELAPGRWDRRNGIGFAGIGTIIRSDLLLPSSKWIVFSSGAGYLPPPKDFGNSQWKIVALRGPLTCQVLGCPPGMSVIDGAALLRCLPRFQPLPQSERSGIAFMPHYESLRTGNWKEVCRQCGFVFLDPHAPSEITVEQIRRSKLVLADAMHAAIVADVFRVPWIPLMTSPHISTFKWLDWTLTVDVPYRPIPLPPSSAVEVLRSRTVGWYGERYSMPVPTAEGALSDYYALRRRKEKYWWPSYAKWCRRLVSSIPRKIAASPHSSSWKHTRDKPHMERASAALRLASISEPFLSREETLADRIDDLQSRFHALMLTSEEALFADRSACDGSLVEAV